MLQIEKSAEVIVVEGKRAGIENRRTHRSAKDRTLSRLKFGKEVQTSSLPALLKINEMLFLV